MAIFGPKPWDNRFGKMSIFRLFELLLFIAQKGLFLFQNIVKDIFQAYLAKKKKEDGKMTIFSWPILPKKKKLEKWPFLDQNHWLTLLEKKAIFRLFQLLYFYNIQRSFFVTEYRKRHSPALFCRKKRSWKNDHFWTKTMG